MTIFLLQLIFNYFFYKSSQFMYNVKYLIVLYAIEVCHYCYFESKTNERDQKGRNCSILIF